MKKIIHIDMDAFFAAAEIRENPQYKGKPVIVGGNPHKRGVVSTCSYEARKYGIHSAMPAITALRLCPHAIFLRPNFDLYSSISRQIREIFYMFTDVVEPVSIDEAYLDVTENKFGEKSATILARKIKKEIFAQTKLTASAGVSYNKFLAKIASEMDKPDGLFVIRPQDSEKILNNLPIGKFHGIGKVTEAKMKNMNIYNGRDLKKQTLQSLINHFGRVGEFYYNVVRGIDNRKVGNFTKRSSYGKEGTFEKDIDDINIMLDYMKRTSERIAVGLQKKNIHGKTISIKVKYADFKVITRNRTLEEWTNDADVIYEVVKNLLIKNLDKNKKVRLLGVSLSNIENKNKVKYIQLLFDFYK